MDWDIDAARKVTFDEEEKLSPPTAAPSNTPARTAPASRLSIDSLIEQEGAGHLAPVIKALYGQESGSGANNRTSVDGARSGMQVIPSTFSRFADKGWDINNEEHGLRAGIRYAKYLGDKFGNDPSKIAAGYFSGEGNVPRQGAGAFIRDTRDGNGKSVSGYVADIQRRLGPQQATAAPSYPRWAEVAAKPEYQSMQPEEQDATRRRYFVENIAPQIPTDQLDATWAQFDADSRPKSNTERVLDRGKEFLSAITGTAPQQSVMEGYAPPGSPDTNKSPVIGMSEAGYNKYREQFLQKTPEQLQRLSAQGGVMGQLADRVLQEKSAYTAKVQSGLATKTDELAMTGRLAPATAEEKAAQPISAADFAKDLWTAIKGTPTAVAGTAASLAEGSDPTEVFGKKDWKDTAIEAARKQMADNAGDPAGDAEYIFGITRSKLRNFPQQLSYSLLSMGAGLAAGLPAAAGVAATGVGAPAAPAAGYAAGAAAAGMAAYRMDTNGFLRDIRQSLDQAAVQSRGKPLTDEEFVKVAEKYQGLVQKHGLYEALPEAASQVFGFALGKTIVKNAMQGGLGALARGVGAAGLEFGNELGTETITQLGQHNTEVEAGTAGPDAKTRSFTSLKDIKDSAAEVLPDVLMLTGVMAGGAHVGGKAYAAAERKLAPGRVIGRELQSAVNGTEFTKEGIDQAARDALLPSGPEEVSPSQTSKASVAPAAEIAGGAGVATANAPDKDLLGADEVVPAGKNAIADELAQLEKPEAPREEDKALGSEIAKALEPAYGSGSVSVVRPEALPDRSGDVDGRRQLGKDEYADIEQLGQLFGKRVVLFDSTNDQHPDAFVRRADNDTIYLNTKAADAAHSVLFGHELDHLMSREAPEIHKAWREAVMAAVPDLAQRAGEFYPNPVNPKTGKPLLTDEAHQAEIVADLMGNRFAEPEFRQTLFNNLAARSDGRTVLKKALDIIQGLIDKVKALGPMKKFKADALVSDLKKVRREAARALGKYVVMQQRAKEVQASAKRVASTPEFKKWFGGSKVVDEKGEPLVVYHGTGADFGGVFDTNGRGKTSDAGAFFSSSPSVADSYTGRNGGLSIPAYLSLQRVVVVDAGGKNWNSVQQKAKVFLPTARGTTKSTSVRNLFKGEWDYPDDTASTDDLARWARANGYDGLVVKNVSDRGSSGSFQTDEAKVPSDIYVAFRPEQIKSATGNSGTFDPTNPDITASARRGPYTTSRMAEMNRGFIEKKEGTAFKVVEEDGKFYLESTNEKPQGQADRAAAAQERPAEEPRAAVRDNGRPAQAAPRHGKPREGAVEVEGVHFSTGERSTLVGGFYGSGLKGVEAERIAQSGDPRLKSRIYFYVNEGSGVKPEPGVGSIAHRAKLSNVYDASADNDGLFMRAKGDMNAFESAVLDAGYDGYYTRQAFSNMGAAVLLGSQAVNVQRIGQGAQDRSASAVAPSPVLSEDRKAADVLLKSNNLPSGARTGPEWATFLQKAAPQVYAALERNDLTSWLAGEGLLYRDPVGKKLREAIAGVTASARRVTETPEFKKWFGDSKVVDEKGEPLVVYHGTNADFEAFDHDLNGSSGQGSGEFGFFFDSSPANAARYVRQNVDGGSVVPVFVSLQNPLRVEKYNRKYGYEGVYSKTAFFNFIDDALENGHDGAIFYDVLDRGSRSTQFVAFRPEQIKSAIGNSGAFDPTNPDITASAARDDLTDTYAAENKTGVIVGARPGEFNWNPGSDGEPAPIQHPVQRGPRLEKIGEGVRKILSSKQVGALVSDLFGVQNLTVAPTLGSWQGKSEPSFVLAGDNLTFEAADDLSKLLGFAFAQDATVVTQPRFEPSEDEIPAFYVGAEKRLSGKQLSAILEAARAEGLDYTTTTDGRAVKFLYFGDEDGLAGFQAQVDKIADAAKLPLRDVFFVRSSLNEAENYTAGRGGEAGQKPAWLEDGGAGASGLFGRAVDHLIVPYARLVGSEGYRFSPDRFGERFGLTADQVALIRSRLRPKSGLARSTAPILTGEEKLEVPKNDLRAKEPRSNNTDILWALQNRAAQTGLIEPGDYSPEARKVIAQAIADEIIHHVSRPGGKSAIGWYDAALKRAKDIYDGLFPEIANGPAKEMLFDAVLGITSQGNDVFANSLFAVRLYQLTNRQGMTLGEAVKTMAGSFGSQTRAIEGNLLKFEHLVNVNGYERMRGLFNEKKTVAEWNAILRRDESLYGPDGKPLSVEGAARQRVTGWMVFGPKIGSFINNLDGDYSTLTADLWFSRSWNRILGYSFIHSPQLEAKQYQRFKEEILAEHNGEAEGQGDLEGMTDREIDALLADPEAMLDLARGLEKTFREGGYKQKSDLRRAAKNWVENRDLSVAIPRSDHERAFQQDAMEDAQQIIKRKTGQKIEIADMQAALWYHEKELFRHFGASDVKREPADYADAAKRTAKIYRDGDLFYVDNPKPRYILGEKGDYLGGDEVMASARRVTETPEFKKWFGDSKVVDEKGDPLVVYHGSPSATFTTFDVGAVGAFFSDRFDVAASYAGRYNDVEFDEEGAYVDDEEDQGVYSAYLSAKNPMVVDWRGKDWGVGPEGLKLDDWAARAKRAGYDSLVVENVVDTGWLAPGLVEDDGLGRVFVVFRPEQVKSATGNNGAFNQANPDITASTQRDPAIVSQAIDRAIAREQGRRVSDLSRESATVKLRSLRRQLEAGKIDEGRFIFEVDQLSKRLDLKAADKAFAGPQKRVRGADFVRQKILEAKRNEDISAEAADFLEWFALKNPALLDDLGISVRAAKEHEKGAAGRYMPASRVMVLMRGAANKTTAVHETLHHLERLMPAEMQDAIRGEWLDAVGRAYREAVKTGDKDLQRYTELVTIPSMRSMEEAGKLLKDGKVDRAKYYPLLNASEFWAVRMTGIAQRRFAADSVWAKSVQWLREALEHIKGALGLRSDAPMLRALNDLLKNGDGKAKSKEMLGLGMSYEQPAWHGSPHKFDKFSLDAIGTGEGAQAYGWGLYFAGKKDVAEYYKEKLSNPQDYLGWYVEETPEGTWAVYTAEDEVVDVFDTEEDAEKSIAPVAGALYQVEIPEENEYLRWDEPLSAQPKGVRESLRKVADEYADIGLDQQGDLSQSIADNEKGDAFYRLLSQVAGSAKNASRDLHRNGVAGIRYLDGTSRDAGEGSYNYVVFDDSRVEITDIQASVLRIAWHGSPHKFDKFSLDAIGTGEGAQAYGWGLYFAGKKDVAEWYRHKLAGYNPNKVVFKGQEFDGNNGREMMAFARVAQKADGLSEEATTTLGVLAMKHRGDLPAVFDEVGSRLIVGEDEPDPAPFWQELEHWAMDQDTEALNPAAGGALYQVEIPEENEYLLWDKPLSEQPEAIQRAVDTVVERVVSGPRELVLLNSAGDIEPWSEFFDRKQDMTEKQMAKIAKMLGPGAGKGEARWVTAAEAFSRTTTGEALYKDLARNFGSDKAASEYLHALGIAGIKYLDGTSRSAGEGSYNYVVFDDSRVEITDVQASVVRKALDARDNALRRLDAAVDGLANLPDQFDYLTDRYRALGRIARVDEITSEIRKAFDGAGAADKQAVYDYLTNAGANANQIGPKDLRDMALRLKRTINYVGDQLVARGLLDPAVRAKFKDQYLPRMYLKHLMSNQDWKILGAGKKPSDMGYLKERKNIPEEVRELILGEVKDPAFLGANAIGRSMRDIAILDWLGKISQNGNWVFPGVMLDFKGQQVSAYYLKAEADRIEGQIPHYTPANQAKAKKLVQDMRDAARQALANLDVDHTLYKQIPDTHRYGMLRGLYVRKEIHSDIMGMSAAVNPDPTWFEKVFGMGHIGTKLTQYWKFTKVALNPPGQVRNFVSNMVMLQLSGVPLHKLPLRFAEAVRDIKANGPYWKVAKKYGVTESTFNAQELFRIKDDLLSLEAAGSMNPISWIKLTAAKVFEKVSDAYQFTEALGKTMKIIDVMKAGGTEAEAAIEAQKWLFDYSLVPQWARIARNSPVGMPFISYQIKVLPRLVEVATTAPWRLLPWVGLLYGMAYYAAASFGVDKDDLDKLKKALPEWLQDKGFAAFLPMKDGNGRVQVLDMSYFFPWTFYTDLSKHAMEGKGGKVLQDLAGMFSSPVIGSSANLVANYDSFTKKPIYNPADPPSYQAAAITNYLYDLMAPPVISSHGVLSPMGLVDKQYGGKLVQGLTGTTNKFGDPRATTEQALWSVLGVNFYGMDPEHTRATNLLTMSRKVQDAEARLKQKLYDRSLTEEQRTKAVGDYKERMLELGQEAKKYAEESQVPEKLKTRR